MRERTMLTLAGKLLLNRRSRCLPGLPRRVSEHRLCFNTSLMHWLRNTTRHPSPR